LKRLRGLKRLKEILKPLQQSAGHPAFGWQVQPLKRVSLLQPLQPAEGIFNPFNFYLGNNHLKNGFFNNSWFPSKCIFIKYISTKEINF